MATRMRNTKAILKSKQNGDNSMSLFGRNLGNSSYQPSGASYTAQGPQKQPDIFLQTNVLEIVKLISQIFPYTLTL